MNYCCLSWCHILGYYLLSNDVDLVFFCFQHSKKHFLENDQVSSETKNSDCLGVYAMSAINEIMSKNCVPHDFEDFLLQMFQNTFRLLQRIVQEYPVSQSYLSCLPPK